MSQVSAELVPFQDSTQLVLSAASMELVNQGETVGSEQVYLATDMIQGQYGQTAFGLVIPRPGRARPSYYSAEEGPCGDYDNVSTDERLYRSPQDTLRHAHYYNTLQGFVMLRTVALPKSLSRTLGADKFLGPAVLDKSCLEDTINPDDFDEEYGLWIRDSIGWTMSDDHLSPVEDRLMQRLADVHGEDYGIARQYVSWHSYRAYAQTVEATAQASRATVANLNKVFGLLIKTPTLPIFDQAEQITVPTLLELTPTQPEA
jgi:hypothetical protein